MTHGKLLERAEREAEAQPLRDAAVSELQASA